MDDTTQTAIIISFFGFLFTGLVGLSIFFVTRLIKTIDKLTETVEQMDKQMIAVLSDMDTQSRQIAHLTTHRCTSEECPFFDPQKAMTPFVRSARTRIGDE